MTSGISQELAAEFALAAMSPPPGLPVPQARVDLGSALDRAAAAFGGYDALARAAAAAQAAQSHVAAPAPPPGLELPAPLPNVAQLPGIEMHARLPSVAQLPGLEVHAPLPTAAQLQASLALSMHQAMVMQAMAAQTMAAQAVAAQAQVLAMATADGGKQRPARGSGASRGDSGKEAPARRTFEAPRQKGLRSQLHAGSGALSGLALFALTADGHAEVLQMLDDDIKGEATAAALMGAVFRLSLDRYGCRVVQRALEVVGADAAVALALELRGHVLECTQHMHGNFVVQKCIERLPQNSLDFIVEELQGQAAGVAAHMFGCRAVQRLFERCSPNQLQVLVSRILRATGTLARDNFGNNVLRHLLEHGAVQEKRHIMEAMLRDVSEAARNKSSSLVYEKCLHVAAFGEHAAQLESERAALVKAVIGCEAAYGKERSILQEITLDRFGNYIVQRVIECSRGSERQVLRKQLMRMEPELRGSATGRHILASMRRSLGAGHTQGAVVGGA